VVIANCGSKGFARSLPPTSPLVTCADVVGQDHDRAALAARRASISASVRSTDRHLVSVSACPNIVPQDHPRRSRRCRVWRSTKRRAGSPSSGSGRSVGLGDFEAPEPALRHDGARKRDPARANRADECWSLVRRSLRFNERRLSISSVAIATSVRGSCSAKPAHGGVA
jgi:hypothetical protein